MSKLIIICGLPGSGKTTLARELSKKTKVALISKDSIKEKLYESMNLSTLEDSKNIGIPAFELMIELTENQLVGGVDVIMEAPLKFPEDYQLFKKWRDEYGLELFSVICSVDSVERKRRFRDRERHQAHHDFQREIDEKEDGYDYATMPGKQIRIVTNKPTTELIEEIMEKIKENKSIPVKG
ncbi:MAG: AAA family ATPase [Candidatus Moranbacteria bacterium]|nr:AAA family ATPase [Candidatus Moranbacteria bacterium]